MATAQPTVTAKKIELFEAFDELRGHEVGEYFERFELYCEVMEVEQGKRVKLLLSSIGGGAFSKLKTLVTPRDVKQCTYAEIKQAFEEHYNPKHLIIMERHKFRERKQKEDESFRDFLAELKQLSQHCGFENNVRLEEELMEQLVRGIRDERLRTRFLSTPELTLDSVIKKSLADEKAKSEASNLKIDCNASHVSKINANHKKNKFVRKTVRNLDDREKRITDSKPPIDCYRCGKTGHPRSQCRMNSNVKCYNCKRTGHTSKACRRPEHGGASRGHAESHFVEINGVDSTQKKSHLDKIVATFQIENRDCIMEIDTGSPVSMSLENFKRIAPHITRLEKVDTMFVSYTKDRIPIIGRIEVKVQYKSQCIRANLYIANGERNTLCGREWLKKIKLNWLEIAQTQQKEINIKKEVTVLMNEFAEIFENKVGCIKGITAKVEIKKDSKPIHMGPRKVPYALTERVNSELDRLENLGILEKVKFAEWATPIVPVVKANGRDIRICGDYKVTVNRHIIPDQHPIPHIEDILATMKNARYFAKFDIREAYLHLKTNKKTADLLTVTTQKGLYRVKRLMYGITNAPSIWQRTMDDLFRGSAGIRIFYDDVKITASDKTEFIDRIKEFFKICKENGIKLKKEKCEVDCSSIQYLGYKIDKRGLHETQEKIEAITRAKRPTDVTEVKSFLGLVNYYNRFVPNAAHILHPIYELLGKEKKFVWTQDCDNAFQLIKKEIASERVLCHFDPAKPIILATDASAYGLGATLSHRFPDGSERPIAFMSRRLNKTERRYAQIDKEAMGIFWGVKRFFDYLYGRKFILMTDHKPLKSIFAPNASLPVLSATRMLHYAIFLSGFAYEIEYRRTNEHSNADFCSRFPVGREMCEYTDEPMLFEINQIATLPVTAAEIARETQKDGELAELYRAILKGEGAENEKAEYAIQQGCLMRGIRVVIPKTLKEKVLKELHEGHLGTAKMCGLARSYCYWRGIDNDIKDISKNCDICMMEKSNPRKTILHTWEYPSTPWYRIHIDYAGPVRGTYLLIIIDAYSKWLEVYPTSKITSKVTIECLRDCFARFGLPAVLVSDNGPNLVSTEFEQFLKENGIKHVTSAPYHPSSNGQAERGVQTVKLGLRKVMRDSESIQAGLTKFLTCYRQAPHSATKETPAQLMFKRNLRTRLDLIVPSVINRMNAYNDNMYKCNSNKDLQLEIGDRVQFRVYQEKEEKWQLGSIKERCGNSMYLIESIGKIYKRHIDQIVKRVKNTNESVRDHSMSDEDGDDYNDDDVDADVNDNVNDNLNEDVHDNIDDNVNEDNVNERGREQVVVEQPELRRSQRIKAKPHRYTPCEK